jgi:hypothetical protein
VSSGLPPHPPVTTAMAARDSGHRPGDAESSAVGFSCRASSGRPPRQPVTTATAARSTLPAGLCRCGTRRSLWVSWLAEGATPATATNAPNEAAEAATPQVNSRAGAKTAAPAAEHLLTDAQPFVYIEPPLPGSPALPVAAQADDGEETATEPDDEEPEPGDGVVAMAAPRTPPRKIEADMELVDRSVLSPFVYFEGGRMWWRGSELPPARWPQRSPSRTTTSPRGSLKRKNAFDWGR